MDDAELTRLALAAAHGDRVAATEFINRTYHQVWRLLVVLADREVAEDLAQETFARAFRSLPGFRAEASARAWLLSIARRVAADHIRSIRRRPEPAGHDGSDDRPPPADGGDLGEAVALRGLIDELDPDRKLAFVLTQVLGLSYAEAAAVCGCPVGTVRSRVARARDDLAGWLGGRAGGPGRRRDARG